MSFHIADHRITANPALREARRRLIDPISGVRAVVMLAGSVRANQLRKATGRSPLELPVGNNRSVMDCWREQIAAMATRAGLADLPLRVMVDQGSGMVPGPAGGTGPVQVNIERDPSMLRGTAGLLSDLAREYADHDSLLVVHASRLPFEPLDEVLPAAFDHDADVSIVADLQGEPAGITLIRCGTLRGVNPVGYVDLNEQWLPQIARQHDIRVARTARPITRSLRTLSSYLDTLRDYHRRQSGRLPTAHAGPLSEDWQASFSVLEAGASIHETAVVHDAVVLSGARVEANTVLVRCVVCPGAVVTRGRSEVDRVVSA